MKITNTILTAQATQNYQVGKVEMEISDYTQEEFNQVKAFCINEAKKIVASLQEAPVKEEPKVEVQTQNVPPRAPYVMNFNNQQPAATYNKTYQNAGNSSEAGVSESQINFLKKLGYKGDFNNLTKQQASELIQQLKK